MEVTDLSIKNFGIKRKHHPLLPKSLRSLIIGKSSCGKSTLLYNLLLRPSWLDYNNLIVFGNSLHQPEYRVIGKGFEKGLSKAQVLNLFQNQNLLNQAGISPLQAIEEYEGGEKKNIDVSFYQDCEMIPDPSTLDPRIKHLLILDDCYLGSQSKASAFYSRGRHSNCDTIYISQNYFRLPRGCIRENANFFIIFKQDSKNVSHIHSDHCSDIPLEEFRSFCDNVWQQPHNFITIDLTSALDNGRLRKNLDTFYIPNKLLNPGITSS